MLRFSRFRNASNLIRESFGYPPAHLRDRVELRVEGFHVVLRVFGLVEHFVLFFGEVVADELDNLSLDLFFPAQLEFFARFQAPLQATQEVEHDFAELVVLGTCLD